MIDVTSDRQAASNRRNAQNSTGPRTISGKKTASRNAFRHGLAARRNPLSSARVVKLSQIICGEEAGAMLQECALTIADAQAVLFDLRRVRRTLLEQIWESISVNSATDSPRDISELHQNSVSQLIEELMRLDRYERRAVSRRRRALRVLDNLTSSSPRRAI